MALVSAAAASAGARRVPARADSSSSAGDGAGAGAGAAPPVRRTRVVLPRGKALKWSTGVAPGEYGGPPTTTKLRKYWGGRGDEDPVTATDDFIWNKEFLSRMRRLLRDDPPNPNPPHLAKEEDSGFLSLNRAMSLNSVEIDLSKELRPPSKPVLEQQVEAARLGLSAAESSAAKPRWRLVPTRREQAKWDRANKAATGGSDVLLRESRRERGDPKVLEAQSREQYFKLKQKLQILTLGIGGVGVVSAFGAGLVGSLVYMRMLGNSIDSMADGAKGLVKGAIGQPRLLVPVALVMMYNRWNELFRWGMKWGYKQIYPPPHQTQQRILVPDYGFMHLELIPMLVGFFTYKIATFVQAIQDALFVVENPRV
ncbi:uncharacterized protein LOC109717510 isoform X2 [Ananas comosus]|uniref:Uncharacterized protein LOC109717510 isoform X2 n=1 Tax=Ananas comosus TaxID=4615 RepID=A0A6P5G117_ANACO|nr:uncharacterized protein LOC109717510 isoform X2 [Ananas comosus]